MSLASPRSAFCEPHPSQSPCCGDLRPGCLSPVPRQLSAAGETCLRMALEGRGALCFLEVAVALLRNARSPVTAEGAQELPDVQVEARRPALGASEGDKRGTAVGRQANACLGAKVQALLFKTLTDFQNGSDGTVCPAELRRHEPSQGRVPRLWPGPPALWASAPWAGLGRSAGARSACLLEPLRVLRLFERRGQSGTQSRDAGLPSRVAELTASVLTVT